MNIWDRSKILEIICQHLQTKDELKLYYTITSTDIASRWVELVNKNNELNNNKRWTTRIMSQLDFMNQLDESHRFPSLLDYIEKLDSIRPIKFSQQYKDYYEILRS